MWRKKGSAGNLYSNWGGGYRKLAGLFSWLFGHDGLQDEVMSESAWLSRDAFVCWHEAGTHRVK